MGVAAEDSGTTHGRSRLRRAVALATGALMLLVPVNALPGDRAQAASAPASPASPAATGSRTVEVSIDSLSPSVPVKGDTITIDGTVRNTGRSAVTDAHVGVRVGDGGPLSNRSAITAAAGRGGLAPSDGAEIAKHRDALPDIPAGITVPFSLDVPVKALGLRRDGVYQLGVSLTGRTEEARYDHTLGIERTFLPWYDGGKAEPTRVTMLWPVVDASHVAAVSSPDEQRTPVFRNDALADDIAPGGRLRQLVEIGRDLPVTWVVDPDLLATVEAMTRPYEVAGEDGDTDRTTRGRGTEAAKEWLDGFRKAVAGDEVIALPYADPDLASIAHRGKEVPGTLGQLKSATELASYTVDTILLVEPRTDVAWPVEGAVDSSVVSVAGAAGADKVITRSDSLREPRSLSHTPNAARPVGAGITALNADAELSTAFTGDMTDAGRATLAGQQFLAQTLMIGQQSPDKQRSVLVAPQRRPTASQARAMAEALTAAEEGGWITAVDFDTATKAAPDPDAGRAVPGRGSYPGSLSKQELGTDAFREIQSTQDKLDGFVVILSQKDRVTTPFGTALMRATSNSWRTEPDGAAPYREDIDTYLDSLVGAVHLLDKSTVTLSGRSATIPVTVENNLAQKVEGLELRLTSSQPNRLDPGAPQEVVVEGGHTRSLKFTTEANANGRAWVTARLYTDEGVPYGAPVHFQVNVTSVTDVVLLVIAGGLLLLVLAGIRMYTQRKRAAREAAEQRGGPEDGSDGGQEDEQHGGQDGGQDGGQPGETGPDTDPGGPGAPSEGEKVGR